MRLDWPFMLVIFFYLIISVDLDRCVCYSFVNKTERGKNEEQRAIRDKTSDMAMKRKQQQLRLSCYQDSVIERLPAFLKLSFRFLVLRCLYASVRRC